MGRWKREEAFGHRTFGHPLIELKKRKERKERMELDALFLDT
jgi:hypothetical protein